MCSSEFRHYFLTRGSSSCLLSVSLSEVRDRANEEIVRGEGQGGNERRREECEKEGVRDQGKALRGEKLVRYFSEAECEGRQELI